MKIESYRNKISFQFLRRDPVLKVEYAGLFKETLE